MGIFTQRAPRSTPSVLPGVGAELPPDTRAALPPRFEAVGEALGSGRNAVDACSVVGQQLAHDGVSLGEALDGLRETSRLVRGDEPAFAETRALAEGWSESTLGYLHHLSCEDPVTGLASLAHLQSRLAELYAGRFLEGPDATHALVVVDLEPGGQVVPMLGSNLLGADLRTARAADTVRSVFDGAETFARVGRDRVVVLARRGDRLTRSVTLLQRMLSASGAATGARVWVEGLPPKAEAAAATLVELARA